jgi:cephalosporin hydroxylase
MKLHSLKSLILGFVSFAGINKANPSGEFGILKGMTLANILATRDLEFEEIIRGIFLQTPSDKVQHGYMQLYTSIFTQQGPFDLVIEFGIGSTDRSRQTNSLTAWSEISKKSKIIGFDIKKKSFFNNSRVTSYFADQTDWQSMERDVLTRINAEQPAKVLIIDDGLHEPSAFINVIRVFNELSNMKTTLVIEDLRLSYLLLLFLWNKSFGYRDNAVLLSHKNGKQFRITKLRHILMFSWNWNNVFVVSKHH